MCKEEETRIVSIQHKIGTTLCDRKLLYQTYLLVVCCESSSSVYKFPENEVYILVEDKNNIKKIILKQFFLDTIFYS